MKLIKILLLGVLFSLAANSFASLDKIEITYDPIGDKRKAKISQHVNLATLSCGIRMTPISDERQNKDTVAHLLSGSLSITNLDSYLESMRTEINSLSKAASPKVDVEAEAKLVRLYTYPESMNINGVMALLVDFKVNGEVVKSEHYRGFYGKTNWANGRGEYLTAINDASYELIERYIASLHSVCQSVQSS